MKIAEDMGSNPIGGTSDYMKYDYRKSKITSRIKEHRKHFYAMLSDHEIKVLLLWALIGPFTALAYIICYMDKV